MTCPHTVRPYPFSEPVALDLDPLFQKLRAEEPISRVVLPYGGEAWLVTRFADVRAVLIDPRFSRAATVGADVPRPRPEIDHNESLIINIDPPEHSRLRRTVNSAFTVRRIEAMRPRVAELTRRLLARMRAEGPGADLVEHVSIPLPMTVICDLLGIPASERDVFRAGADASLSNTTQPPQVRAAAQARMAAAMAELVERRRVEPTDDLLGALVRAHDEGQRLTTEELVAMGVGLLIAGHETSMRQISNMAFLLLAEPSRAEALRAGRIARDRGIDELLRYIPLDASAGLVRIATVDVELSGVRIRAGDAVVVAMHAANRDPEVFDAPEELRLDRPSGPIMTFGHGPHFCLGAQLARMELQEVIGGLLAEFPALRLAVAPEEVEWRLDALVRGPRRLPLSW